MKQFLPVALLVMSTAAFGGTVTYVSSGSINGAGASESCGSGADTAQLVFAGVSNSVGAPTNGSFGTFTASATGAGCSFGAATFVLTITQSVPDAEPSFTFSGTITAGSIDPNSNTLTLNFNTPTSFQTADGVTYTVSSFYPLVSPSTLSGITSIQGSINDSVGTPEPATMGLLGTAFAALGLLRRRARRS